MFSISINIFFLNYKSLNHKCITINISLRLSLFQSNPNCLRLGLTLSLTSVELDFQVCTLETGKSDSEVFVTVWHSH